MKLWHVLLVAGLGAVAVASALLARMIAHYIDNPYALSSTSGNVVFQLHDGYFQYAPLHLGAEVQIVCGGLLLVVVALTLGAATYRAGSKKP